MLLTIVDLHNIILVIKTSRINSVDIYNNLKKLKLVYCYYYLLVLLLCLLSMYTKTNKKQCVFSIIIC